MKEPSNFMPLDYAFISFVQISCTYCAEIMGHFNIVLPSFVLFQLNGLIIQSAYTEGREISADG